MNLEQLRKSNCGQFIYKKMNHEIGTYSKPILVSKQKVIDDVCKSALLATQTASMNSVDRSILDAIEATLNDYTEYELTTEQKNRLSELIGFKQTNWSSLLKD